MLYDAHKGEEAREYMFSREYDRLHSERSRLLLAALAEHGAPLSTRELRIILNCSLEQVSEAISEVLEIFLREEDIDGVETRYAILPVAQQFVEAPVSQIGAR
jgi:Fic family protein